MVRGRRRTTNKWSAKNDKKKLKMRKEREKKGKKGD